nr:cyclin-T-like [Lytechinus pictus]
MGERQTNRDCSQRGGERDGEMEGRGIKNPDQLGGEGRPEAYAQQAQELVINESIILQTLGFEVGVVHPHTHVVKCTQMIRASKDLSQSSYFLATNSLHLTTFCLKYKPTVVACVCIHLACKWTQWTIPKSNDGKGWWEYVDPSVTEAHLDDLTREFLNIIDRCPARLKKRIMGYNKSANSAKDVKRPRSEGQSSSENSQQAGSSTQVDSKASTSSSVYDFSFDSKPASGFDQYSDSEDSKCEEPSSQKTEPTVQKSEKKVKVSIEEYKKSKDRERKEKDILAKQQQRSSAGDKPDTGGVGSSRALPKDFIKQGPKLLPSNIENIISSKERIPYGLEKLSSGKESVHLPHEKSHTGHDRIPSNHEKRPSQDKHLSGSKRTLPSHDKMHSGHTKGPSGPDRLSTERNSGIEKPFSSHGRDPVRPLVHDQTSSSLGIRPQDKVAASSLGSAKHSGSAKQKDHRRSELHIPASAGSSKEAQSLPTERTLSVKVKDVLGKEHGQRSYAQAVKSAKHQKEHTSRPEHPTLHPEKAVKERKPEASKESLHIMREEPEQEHATQGTLDLLNQISAEIMKDIEKETTNPTDPVVSHPVPILQSVKKESRIPEDLKDRLQVPPVPTSVKPVEKSHGESESDDIIADVVSPLGAILEERNDRHESKEERREERERKREDRERRREGHRSKKDEKRHKSHKHRHRSPGSSHKHSLENDNGEGSGDMAPSKKQRLDQAGSTHTVLTTSKGIKLKIKGLGNSFNNGSEHGKDTEKANENCDSPGSVSLKLNLSKLTSSPRETGKERDSNHHHHHHHRSHHKHKSRHSRSKDGHRKHSVSPGPSSASDASPAISPSKKKTVEMYETATNLQNQSLLDLPMPPSISKTSSRHASPVTKHGKRKRESNPPLPNEDVPPPPPPPPQSKYRLPASSSLQSMQFSTIDASALYDIQPPLPSGRPREQRPPPPPPVTTSQRRPHLPH